MIKKIKDLFFTVKDKIVSLSLNVCRNLKQFAVFSAKKVSDGTGKFASLIVLGVFRNRNSYVLCQASACKAGVRRFYE